MQENVVNGVKTYSGRDSLIRLVAYGALFLYGVIDLAVKHLSSNEEEPIPFYFYIFTLISFESLAKFGQSCRVVAKQFSTCRLITRFFDDIPAIHSLTVFWRDNFDTENQNIPSVKLSKLLLNWLTVINLLFWVLYNPFEHIAYLGELKVIDVDHSSFYDYTNVCWAGALGTSVLLNLRVALAYTLQQRNKATIENDSNYDKSALISLNDYRKSLFIAFRDFLDFSMAINYMPQGWLPWESRFYHYQVGALGVISSLCRIKQYLFN